MNVLEVMDAAINLRAAIYNDGRGSSCSDVTANRRANLDDAIAARAAIAELIERERKLREALTDVQAQCRRNVELGAMGPGYWSDLSETVDAALAAVSPK